ncbi:cytidine deaminase [Candidatus Riflebacteria bacterium]
MQENDHNSPNDNQIISDLIREVKEVRKNAHAPYSKFYVGAALYCRPKNDPEGKKIIITGCNVENASFGLTNCAERVALARMVAMGCTDPEYIVIFADTDEYIAPCGACRQVIFELAPNAKVLLLNNKEEFLTKTVAEILPFAFSLNS